jgi:ribosome-associated toxin RatA of RatAB toxin-antitoxin module
VTVTSTSIDIAAPPAAIYALAAATTRWPLILPHYRYVRVRERHGMRQIVEMAAWRHIFPLRWVAEQINDPSRPHIAFRHIAGPTTGMDVEWTFEPAGPITRVTIEHRLRFAFPILAEPIGTYVVGGYFIGGVAGKTLACMKRAAEAAARS